MVEMFIILEIIMIQNQNGSSASLDLDLEQYLVPAPVTSVVYAANLTETPRSLKRGGTGVFSNAETSTKDSGVSVDRPATIKVINYFHL